METQACILNGMTRRSLASEIAARHALRAPLTVSGTGNRSHDTLCVMPTSDWTLESLHDGLQGLAVCLGEDFFAKGAVASVGDVYVGTSAQYAIRPYDREQPFTEALIHELEQWMVEDSPIEIVDMKGQGIVSVPANGPWTPESLEMALNYIVSAMGGSNEVSRRGVMAYVGPVQLGWTEQYSIKVRGRHYDLEHDLEAELAAANVLDAELRVTGLEWDEDPMSSLATYSSTGPWTMKTIVMALSSMVPALDPIIREMGAEVWIGHVRVGCSEV